MLLGAVTPLLGEIGDQTGKPLSDEADESLIQHNAVEDEGIETTLETGKYFLALSGVPPRDSLFTKGNRKENREHNVK